MTRRSPFRYFKTSPEIIRLAVMLYVRFPLSLRVLSEETSLLGLRSLGCWVARLGFTANALDDKDLCLQI